MNIGYFGIYLRKNRIKGVYNLKKVMYNHTHEIEIPTESKTMKMIKGDY